MSEKIEDLLNLALEATEEERERSQELEVGFDPLEKEWELIVKYSGDPEQIREIAVNVTLLMNGYAVVLVREDRINDLAGLDGVEFIEKPKNLYFQVENGRNASCINPVQNPPFSLSGRGVLTGIVDSGIDLAHPDFRNEDGTTRVLALWDQTIPGNPPSGYSRGSEYTAEEINRILMPQPMEPGGGTESGEPERAGGVGQDPSRERYQRARNRGGRYRRGKRKRKRGKAVSGRGAGEQPDRGEDGAGQGRRVPQDYGTDGRSGLYYSESTGDEDACGGEYQLWKYIRFS